MVDYDYEELIRRLRTLRCEVRRWRYSRQRDGRDREIWVAEFGGEARTFQIRDGIVAYDVVEMIVAGLGLPRAPFDI